MSFNRQDTTNYFLYDTEIENLFIGEYMLDAPGDYVKIYLLALMYAKYNIPSDNSALAKQLSLSAETVEKAWQYWENVGIIKITDGNIGFINIKEAVFGQCAVSLIPQTPDRSEQNEGGIDLDSKDLSKLFSDVEQTCGRLLEAAEPELIASWLCDFRIPSEVILSCYRYCTEKGKSNRSKYVEKVLMDWREKGLDSGDAVEEFLSENDKQYEVYRKIFRYLGYRRNPSEPDKALMRKWTDEYGFGLDKIFEACDKTTGASNPSLNYIDSILGDWYKKEHGIQGSDGTAQSMNQNTKIRSLYAKIREENERKTAERRREIFAKVPQIEEITEELKSCGFRLVQAMLAGSGTQRAELEKKKQDLENKRQSLLLSNGYTADALDPIYTCRKCKDSGFIDDQTVCSCCSGKF